MDQKSENKRVFFAFEAFAPWPTHLPHGRTLEPTHRHLTLVFLGDVPYHTLEKLLPSFPPPKIKVGLTGKFDRCLFLPSKRPNVVAWHVKWFDVDYDLGTYQKEVAQWLINGGFDIRLHNEGFLPHVTLARRPFQYHEWRESFQVLPVVIKDIHLYESIGGLKYKPLWTYSLLPPFDKIKTSEGYEISIRGESLPQLLHHCITAIAFEFPSLLKRYTEEIKIEKKEDLLPIMKELLEKAHKMDSTILNNLQTLQEPQVDHEGIWNWIVWLRS